MIKLINRMFFLLTSIFTACSINDSRASLVNELTFQFTKQMNRENGLTLFGAGHKNAPASKLRGLALTFETIDYVDIDQARNLLINTCEKLLYQINTTKALEPWLVEYPFTGKNLDLMIGFKKENLDEVDPPYIVLAYAINGMVYYSTNVNDRFKEVYKETYEDALKIYHDRCSFDSL